MAEETSGTTDTTTTTTTTTTEPTANTTTTTTNTVATAPTAPATAPRIMHPRKQLEHMRSNSLPNVFHASSPMHSRKPTVGTTTTTISSITMSPIMGTRRKSAGRFSLQSSVAGNPQLAASDIFTDRMGMIDLNYQDTQKIVRELLEHGTSLPSLNERMSDDALEDVHAFNDLKKVNVRKSLNDLKSSSLPSLNERMSEEDLEDVHAFSNLKKGSTKSLRSSLTEMKSTSMPSLNERMSEEDLEDVHAFSNLNTGSTKSLRSSLTELKSSSLPSLNERMSEEDLEDTHAFQNLKRTSLSDLSASQQLSSLAEIGEEDEEEEEEEEDPQDALANRLFPKNRPNHLTQMKQGKNGPVSMPNIYGVRVSTGGSTSGSYSMMFASEEDEDDLLTDHKGICDLDYGQAKKIVDDVLHHKPHDPKSPVTDSATAGTRSSINSITGAGAEEAMAIVEEEEEEETQADEEVAEKKQEETMTTTPATTTTTTTAEAKQSEATKPKKKKGFFSRLKKRSASLKKF